ncbi:MAG: hypothetical protein M3042_12720 [Actinomycetota bacterium]|nr:hypothetical protein [Actinomycetota bacterium]
MRRVVNAACGLLLLAAGGAALRATEADAVQATHDRVVSTTAQANTPDVTDGTVYAFAQVGNKIFVGGSFTSVTQTKTSPQIPRSRLFAYDATTGAIDTGFAPAVDGEVDALQAGPDGASVYVGGKFNNVNGLPSKKLAKLSTSTGAAVAGFKVPTISGPVNDFALSGGRLFLAGQFANVGGKPHSGLATLNPTTGTVDPYMTVQLTGHHNWVGPARNGFAMVGAYKFDLTSDGSKLVAVGNFKLANGLDRDQVVLVDLGPAGPSIANWETDRYKSPCFSWAFDSWVRDVGFSPDGSYFAVANSGGPSAGTLCDSAQRWETNATGAGLQPTWVDWTGGDSLWSISVTGSAIYVGGHQRWMNNTFASDTAQPGAVGRAGLAALDPINGLPLSWNPGRNPRGGGAFALLSTPSGLFVGSDTNYIGNFQYYHGKFAFFPLAGGKVTPPTTTATLPGTVYQLGKIACPTCDGDDTVTGRTFSGGTAAGPATPVADGTFPWHYVRGAVLINGTVYLGWANGYFYSRPFDGTSFGGLSAVDPYDDPYWSNVSTGRGMTYRGMAPNFYFSQIQYVSSLFYSNGRLYYTLTGQTGMYYRYFTPESGVVGADQFQVSDGGINWSNVAGGFLSGNTLYVAARSNGYLYSISFVNGAATGAFTTVSGPDPAWGGVDWRANAMFLR